MIFTSFVTYRAASLFMSQFVNMFKNRNYLFLPLVHTLKKSDYSSLTGFQKTAMWITTCCNNFLTESIVNSYCYIIFIKIYSKRKWSFLKNAFFLVRILFLATREIRFLYIAFIIIVSFLKYHKLSKALQLTLFYHKDCKWFKYFMFPCRFSPLCCGYSTVFPILSFILLLFFENPSSHIDISACL